MLNRKTQSRMIDQLGLFHTSDRLPISSSPLLILVFCGLWSCGTVRAQIPSDPAGSSLANSEPAAESQEVAKEAIEPGLTTIVLVEGQVFDPCGSGLEASDVLLYRTLAGDEPGELLIQTKTKEFGDYSLTASEALQGRFLLEINQAPYATFRQIVELNPNELPTYVAANIQGAISLKGQVIDHLGNKPIPGAFITFTDACRELYATTNEHGRFTIEGLLPVSGSIAAKAEGFGREVRAVAAQPNTHDNGENSQVGPLKKQTQGIVIAPDAKIAEVTGETSAPQPRSDDAPSAGVDLTIRLKPERIVHIQVVDDENKPIHQATIEAYNREHDDFRMAISDENGIATIRGLHFDAKQMELRITSDKHVSSVGFDRFVEMPRDINESSHKYTLQRAGSITGRIIDANTREPVSGARIIAGDVTVDDTPRDWSNYKGEFEVAGVPSGSQPVTVHMVGYAPEFVMVNITAGVPTKKTIRLKRGKNLRGLVVDKNGDPVQGAIVETGLWQGQETLSLRAMTDDVGKFTIPDAPHDEFEIIVYASGFEEKTAWVAPSDAEPVKITLEGIAASASVGTSQLDLINKPAPAFTVTTSEGEKLTLSELNGKAVVLHFWATWCPGCVADMPEVISLHRRFTNNENFALISVSLDFRERELLDYVEKKSLKWHLVYGEKSGAQEVTQSYGINAIPALFLIDPDGIIRANVLSANQLADQVQTLLQDRDEL